MERKQEIKVWTVKVMCCYPHSCESHFEDSASWEVRTSIPGAPVKRFSIYCFLKALAYAEGFELALSEKLSSHEIVKLEILHGIGYLLKDIEKGKPAVELTPRIMNRMLPEQEKITLRSLTKAYQEGYKDAKELTKNGLQNLMPYDRAL